MTSGILIGPVQVLTEDIVYALPARQVRIMSTVALEVSNIVDSGFAVLANSTTGTDVTAAFTRCTTAAATVVCRAY